MTALHPVDDHRRRREGWERAAPIVIGENTWLGASVTVGAGVSIGRDVVIGAGSVVLHDIPDHVVAAGFAGAGYPSNVRRRWGTATRALNSQGGEWA
ncbi:DapH/DapD/GlmU-related protein [Rhodococcus qingshengii]|uniref:DapH/DapD/GlmU-related protein n=1 Tax=Rhodococcus qingshengii TaxID=334542 RepID=UPI0036DF431E